MVETRAWNFFASRRPNIFWQESWVLGHIVALIPRFRYLANAHSSHCAKRVAYLLLYGKDARKMNFEIKLNIFLHNMVPFWSSLVMAQAELRVAEWRRLKTIRI